MEHFWDHLGPFRALLGAFLGQVGAILGHVRASWAILGPSWPKRGSFTNVVKAYQDFYDHLEVPERGESCLTPAIGPPWGHLGWDPKMVKFLVNFLVPFWSNFRPQNGPQNGPKTGQKFANFGVFFWMPFLLGSEALWVPL